jgi:uncharacterized protein YutE (UPF0331/DUF86 family)
MTIDRDLVTRKLLLITEDLDELRRIAAADVDAYIQSRVDQAVAERFLERMIGRMIDINYHVITEAGHPPPADYHASFTRLGELGILDPEFARAIARCAGLRNRLVHEYNDIDPRKVFESLVAALRDIPLYLRAINAAIASEVAERDHNA